MNKGFTFIEIIVALAIVALASTVLGKGFFSIITSNQRLSVNSAIKQNGEYALSVLERSLREAYTIESTCFGVIQPSISVRSDDGKRTTFECASDDAGTFLASTTDGVVSRITSSDVSFGIDCDERPITFTCSTDTRGRHLVSLSFALYQPDNLVDNPDVLSQIFSTFVTMRN